LPADRGAAQLIIISTKKKTASLPFGFQVALLSFRAGSAGFRAGLLGFHAGLVASAKGRRDIQLCGLSASKRALNPPKQRQKHPKRPKTTKTTARSVVVDVLDIAQ
jgi:hypothetical protein